MTAREAKENQDRIARDFNLGWWYATECDKCCGVYPKIMKKDGYDPCDCYLECEVCHRRTDNYIMPWQAKEAWNAGKFRTEVIQLTLF